MQQNKGTKAAFEDSNKDYRFLRSNGIHARTALRMLALAYMGKLGGETKQDGN